MTSPLVTTTCPVAAAILQPKPLVTQTVFVKVFFDGTNNNKYNVEERASSIAEANKEFLEAASRSLREHDPRMNQAKARIRRLSESSYRQGLSNIALLHRSAESGAPEGGDDPDSGGVVHIYIDGTGTAAGEDDATIVGQGLGLGKQGVVHRATSALRDVVSQVTAEVVSRVTAIGSRADTGAVRLKFELFGFSRGASSARHFLHLVFVGEPETGTLASILQQSLDGLPVTVDSTFVGLFDTVASIGLPTSHGSNTRDYHLDAVRHATHVVHLVAADEYRQNFSSIDTTSCPKAHVVFLPGAHADVGGGYGPEDANEEKVLLELTSGLTHSGDDVRARVQAALDWFVSSGWAAREDLTHERDVFGQQLGLTERHQLTFVRKGISLGYSAIPLRIMADLAASRGGGSFPQLDRISPLVDGLRSLTVSPGFSVAQYLRQYAAKGGSRLEDWTGSSEDWLRRLRRGYFHFSAQWGSLVNAPNFCANGEFGTSPDIVMRGVMRRRVFPG